MDEKHDKYMKLFKSNDLYWGLGIENELYMTFEKKNNVDKKFINKKHSRERYSVDYYTNYKPEILKKINNYMDINEIPILINSHSFTKTDIYNNSKTLYTKDTPLNPIFNGKTMIETLTDNDIFFKENTNYTFDGDTIEIMTYNFYQAKIQNVINELKELKNIFLKKIQECQEKIGFFLEYGKINWMECNYPMARFLTNLKNMAVFCNGTIHFNITLPTRLDDNGDIVDMKIFTEIHKIYIRLIQFFEPIFVAIYGSPDPFSKYFDGLSKASQRAAVSRYIGIGTYDTEKMYPGKILAHDVDSYPSSFWYNLYHEKCNYSKLGRIGLDINFNKFKNHGIEIRFFDHMSDENITESLHFLCFLGDIALDFFTTNTNIDDPIKMTEWNELVVQIFNDGKNTKVSDRYTKIYEQLFDINIESNLDVTDFYNKIRDILQSKYISKLFTRYVF